MLAATADRERAVDVLRAGFAEGRLQEDELEKRVAYDDIDYSPFGTGSGQAVPLEDYDYGPYNQ